MMDKKNNDHLPGEPKRYAAPLELQQQGFTGLSGVIPNDPRRASAIMAMADNCQKPAKVYVAGSCYSCGHLPDGPTPKFCTECGARFVPVLPENAANDMTLNSCDTTDDFPDLQHDNH